MKQKLIVLVIDLTDTVNKELSFVMLCQLISAKVLISESAFASNIHTSLSKSQFRIKKAQTWTSSIKLACTGQGSCAFLGDQKKTRFFSENLNAILLNFRLKYVLVSIELLLHRIRITYIQILTNSKTTINKIKFKMAIFTFFTLLLFLFGIFSLLLLRLH